jgi:hypothetical protein
LNLSSVIIDKSKQRHISDDSKLHSHGHETIIYHNWIQLAQDKGQWPSLVNTVVNLQGVFRDQLRQFSAEGGSLAVEFVDVKGYVHPSRSHEGTSAEVEA